MPFAPGVSGNPGGRPQGPSFAAAIRRQLAERNKSDRTALERIAQTVINKALRGDMDAIRWLADRADGRVAQNVNVSGETVTHVVPWLPALAQSAASVPLLGGQQSDSTASGDVSGEGTDALPGPPATRGQTGPERG